MAIPVKEKTWIHTVTSYYGSIAGLMYQIKVLLTSIGYTVQRSRASTQNGGTASNDDWWLSAADVVLSQSWIVLKSPHTVPWYLCMQSLTTGGGKIVVASDPFTATLGSGATIPTSVTQGFLCTQDPASGNYGWCNNSSDITARWKLHLLLSSDNKDFRLIGCYGGEARFAVMCGEMAENRGAYNPNFFAWMGYAFGNAAYGESTSTALAYTSVVMPNGGQIYHVATTSDTLGETTASPSVGYSYFTYESALDTAIPHGIRMTAKDALTGGDYFGSIGIFNNWHYGRRGRIVDVYWGTVCLPTGYNYPNDGSRQWIKLGAMIFPCDGTQWELA